MPLAAAAPTAPSSRPVRSSACAAARSSGGRGRVAVFRASRPARSGRSRPSRAGREAPGCGRGWRCGVRPLGPIRCWWRHRPGPPTGSAAVSQRIAQGMPARGPLLSVRGVTGQLHVSNTEPLAQQVVAAMTENRCFAQRRDPVLEGPSEAVRDHHDVAAADLAEPEATVTSRAARPRPPHTGRAGDTRGLHPVPRDAGRVGDRRVQLQ